MRRLLPFIIILLLCVLIGSSGLLGRLDFKLLDSQFQQLRKWFPRPVMRDVVIVGIDEDTVRQFPEPIALWHRHLSRFFSAMARARPAAVGVDIVLPDRSYETISAGLDLELMKGILEARRSHPVTLALTLDPAGKPRSIYPAFLAAAGPNSSGFALFPTDSDHTVRHFDERLGDTNELVPTLVGQMARHLNIEPRNGLIDYWRGDTFAYLPMQQVLQWDSENNHVALDRAVGGKPVLVGVVLPFVDRGTAPVQLAQWEAQSPDTPGVLLQAQALRNLLNEGFVSEAPVKLVTGLCAGAALLWFVSVSTTACLVIFGLLCFLLLAMATGLLAQGVFVPVLAPLLSIGLALAARNAHDTFVKLRERRRIRASFSGYVSPSIMDEILAGHLRPELGGAKKIVCVMFSDIRGYTKRSEGLTPEQVIQFLNRYFEKVVEFIHRRSGWVASFMGDGIMAVFGAPQPLDNPCREAFDSARAMLHFVAELNREFMVEGVAPIDIGIGLQVGEAVIGHVGSSARHDYTAIGDVTNVASRLENLTKEAGYRIVLSKAVADQLQDRAGLVPLGAMAIKGHSPVEVYGYDKI